LKGIWRKKGDPGLRGGSQKKNGDPGQEEEGNRVRALNGGEDRGDVGGRGESRAERGWKDPPEKRVVRGGKGEKRPPVSEKCLVGKWTPTLKVQ